MSSSEGKGSSSPLEVTFFAESSARFRFLRGAAVLFSRTLAELWEPELSYSAMREPRLLRACSANGVLCGITTAGVGVVGQLAWPAGKGPWQFAHCAAAVQLAPEGPVCWSIRTPQWPQRAARGHLAGLQ
jgi:hypothetical protein